MHAICHPACCCALGNDLAEVAANLSRGVAPGMVETEGDVPDRRVFFGCVTAPLTLPPEPAFASRTCALIDHCLRDAELAYRALVARYGAARTAVVLGTSNTGVEEAQRQVTACLRTQTASEPPCLDLLALGTPARFLAERLGAAGPVYTVSTACSSSTKVFASAARLLDGGCVDLVIAGGADGRCRFALNGFQALGALAPSRCHPLTENPDGINLGEGCALFALVRAEDAPRGICLAGYGESSDAFHVTAPDPEGEGAERAMREALARAACAPDDVGYVNCHGTGTQANDTMELKACARVFGATAYTDRRRFVSTKSLTGHCLGAAGAVEAALAHCVLARGAADVAMSNSFAFGGSNASIVLKRI